MPDPSKRPIELTQADMTALRYLAIAWAGMIAAIWLVLDDPHTQLFMIGVAITIMVASLLSIYLLRRWRNRR